MHGQGESMPRELAGLYTLLGVLTYSALYGHAHINNTNNTNHSNNNSGYCDRFDYQADSSSRYGRPVNASPVKERRRMFPNHLHLGMSMRMTKSIMNQSRRYIGVFVGGTIDKIASQRKELHVKAGMTAASAEDEQCE